jgi:FolB domain-containing protein
MNQFYRPQGAVAPVKLAFVQFEGIDVTMEIGIHSKELGRQQRITIDIEVGFADHKTNIEDSAEGLKHGFDYSQVYDCVREATSKKVNLLETLTNKIANSILMLDGALTCSVKVSKNRFWANIDRTGLKIYREKT